MVVALVLLPSLAHAHDFWFEHEGDAFVLQYGHRGGKVLAIEAAKLKSIRCLPRGGASKEVLPQAVFSPTTVTIRASCEAVSAFYHGGYWSKTPDGDKNLPKNRAGDAVSSWESMQFAKWVNARNAAASAPLGDLLEIVPVTDLSGVKQGDKVTVRVLLQGKPVSSAIASMDHKPLGETDGAGQVRLRVRASTLETISVSIKRPLARPEADQQVLEASLSFEVNP